MTKIISIINYKGGVGKTTTTLNVGAALSKFHSKKVLLIDLDPQTNLTLSLMPFKKWKKAVTVSGSIKDLFEAYINRNYSYSVKNAIIKNPVNNKKYKNLDILPAHLGMLLIDLQLAQSFILMGDYEDKWLEIWGHKSILYKNLKLIENEYDVILIDCPPNFNIITQNAIFASDFYIIPSIPDYLSVLGMKIIEGLIKEIDNVSTKIAEILKRKYVSTPILGILFTRVKIGSSGPVQLHKTKMKQINKMYPKKAFNNYITDSIAIPESSGEYVPIFEYKKSKAKHSQNQFKKLAEEIVERLKL